MGQLVNRTQQTNRLIELNLTLVNFNKDDVKRVYSDDELGFAILYDTETGEGSMAFETTGQFGGSDNSDVKYEFKIDVGNPENDFTDYEVRKAAQRIIKYRMKFLESKLDLHQNLIDRGHSIGEKDLSAEISMVNRIQKEIDKYLKREITNCPK